MEHIAIDTCIFYGQNYSFKGRLFSILKKLCEDNQIKLLISEIVDKEIKQDLISIAKETENDLKNTIKPIKLLKGNENYIDLISLNVISSLEADLLAEYAEFFSGCSADLISVTHSDIETITNQYFSVLPPFGSGTKKSEFPDAIAISSLVEYKSSSNIEELIVVSSDNDWKKSLTPLTNIHLYDNLFDLFKAIANHELYNEAFSRWFQHSGESLIENKLQDAICDDVDPYHYAYDDSEMTDNNTSVDSILGYAVIFVDEENKTFDIEVKFSLDVCMTFDYDDYDTGYYDREDGAWGYLEHKVMTVSGKSEGYAIFSISYANKGSKINIKTIEEISEYESGIDINDSSFDTEDISIDPYEREPF